MNRVSKRVCAIGAAFLLMMCATACSTSDVVTSLNAAVAAADAAVSVLVSNGNLSPATANQIATYLGDAAVATSQAAVELASSDDTATKVQIISADFASVVKKPEIANLSPQAATAIAAVDAAIHGFLNSVGAPNGRMSAALVASAPKKIHISRRDRSKLTEIRSHAVLVALRAGGLQLQSLRTLSGATSTWHK